MIILKYLLLFAFLVLSSPSVSAQSAEKTELPSTRIEVNEEDDVITFIIKGEEAARLTSDGLEVLGSISYGGTMHDHNGKAFSSTKTDLDGTD